MSETCIPRNIVSRLADRSDLLRRLVVSLVWDELSRLKKRPVSPLEYETWSDQTDMTDEGLGFDSLARLELMARFNQFFGLHRTGIEDQLLVRPTIGAWTNLLSEHFCADTGPCLLTFQSSGSFGLASTTHHSIYMLEREVAFLATKLDDTKRIVATVPPHHLYGFVLTILLPALMDLPVADVRHRGPGSIVSDAVKKDLIVATPFLWSTLVHSGVHLAQGVSGVVSSAPTDIQLWADIHKLGIGKMLEIYGSTETSGIGYRTECNDEYELFPYLYKSAGEIFNAQIETDGDPLLIQDQLVWSSDRTFRLGGRKDKAVQVGGTNVNLSEVRKHLLACQGVRDVAVRMDGNNANSRLFAFVVPSAIHQDPVELRRKLDDHVKGLSPPQRPHSISIGSCIPVNEMGKLTDWTVG